MSTEDAARMLYRTAIHEAGHAVVGRAVTMACGSATIVADDESAGHAVIADPLHRLGQLRGRLIASDDGTHWRTEHCPLRGFG